MEVENDPLIRSPGLDPGRPDHDPGRQDHDF